MNAKTTLVAAALALLAGAASATDVVQLPAERGQLTRAEVRASLRTSSRGRQNRLSDYVGG